MAGSVGYNPYDREQAALLAALRKGEGGNYTQGYGGVDLSGAQTDASGFPLWGGNVTGAGPTHAAGAYQFQPGTWRSIAAQFGLDFRKPEDQDAGAWYNAQKVYGDKTGRSLDADLDAGAYTQIQQALASEWTSATGNAANPQGLAAAIAAGVRGELAPGPSPGGTPSWSWSDPVGSGAAILTSYFVRGGMILVGGLILLVALWAILAHNDVVPGPKALVS